MFATVLGELPSHPERLPAADAQAAFGPLDATGVPVSATAEPAEAGSATVLDDAGAKAETLRRESAAVIAALDATPPGRRLSRFLAKGWGLVRTALFAAAGALITTVGGLLVKGYSELIVRRLTWLPVLHDALGSAVPTDPEDAPEQAAPERSSAWPPGR